MKKFTVILLLLIYGSSTAGATIHLHYCMNEFVGWSLFSDGKSTCGKCGMEESGKNGCCKDEHKHVQLKTDHQKTSSMQMFELLFSPLSLPEDSKSEPDDTHIIAGQKFPLCHAPPGARQAPLHILNCIFLI